MGNNNRAATSSRVDLTIDPSQILLGERVGIGSFGEVHRALWRGTEVAVKRFWIRTSRRIYSTT